MPAAMASVGRCSADVRPSYALGTLSRDVLAQNRANFLPLGERVHELVPRTR